ncbi:hypothetical protein HEP84_45170 [Streptomyces sp. RLB1-33]|nr:hypothetical protein [Streptomyces sp. RLB1-33]QIY67949.1 hypothetical protein HEP84_45170 [Streptomyces sp. RLB1-33]
MIVLGIIPLVIGLVAGISILSTIGVILVVIGVVLWIVGALDHGVGGRKHHWLPLQGPGRTVSKEEAGNRHGRPVKSTSHRGEEQSKTRSDAKGMHDTGPKGRSRRPSGTRDASATTGVDPQDPPGSRRARFDLRVQSLAEAYDIPRERAGRSRR